MTREPGAVDFVITFGLFCYHRIHDVFVCIRVYSSGIRVVFADARIQVYSLPEKRIKTYSPYSRVFKRIHYVFVVCGIHSEYI